MHLLGSRSTLELAMSGIVDLVQETNKMKHHSDLNIRRTRSPAVFEFEIC